MPYILGNFSCGKKKEQESVCYKKLTGVWTNLKHMFLVKYFPVQRHSFMCILVACVVWKHIIHWWEKKCQRGRKDEGIGLNQKTVSICCQWEDRKINV